MRVSLLRIGAVALLAVGTLGAQIHPSLMTNEPAVTSSQQLLDISTDMFPAGYSVDIRPNIKQGPSTQVITWGNLFSSRFGPYFDMYHRSPIFQYDQGSNSLNVVRATGEGTGTLTGVVQIVSSIDGGASWTGTEVFRRSGYLMLIAGLAISNQGVSTLAESYWTVFAQSYEFDGTSYPLTGSVGLFKTSGDAFDVPMLGPDLGNGGGYEWSQGELVGVNGADASVHHVSRLNPPDGVQYGAYGQWGFDPNVEDYTASSIPSQWDINQFGNPNNIASTLNSSPSLGADSEGRLYMVVSNLFADDDQVRVAAVSKSEDQGSTWSAFERMPKNLLETYRTTVGWDNIGTYGPYHKNALVVTGVNSFSYFFRLSQLDDQNRVINLDIAEARYDNGTWTLTRIAELNGFPLQFSRADEPSDAIGPAAWIPGYELGSFGHELAASITADGQSILLQWIDENPALGYTVFSPPAVVYFNGANGWVEDQLDSLLSTDIYFAHRRVDGAWSTPVNITNDQVYDHGTRLPSVIPDLSNVPVVKIRPGTFDQYNQQYALLPALRALPALIYDATIDNSTVCNLQFGTYNALNPNSVEADVEQYAFTLNSVSPNPAQQEAEVDFTLDAPGMVTLDVFASTGSKIATVYSGQLNAGIHGLTVDASTYASGTYYIALTVNGQRLTQPLSIVK